MSSVRLKRQRRVTECIFCRRTDLSREHVWPEWSREFLRKTKTGRHFASQIASSPADHRISGPVSSKERFGDVTTIKLKVVCKNHCNGGWMSRLETLAKPVLIPLFTGKSASLNKYNQEVVATWIAMKLVVCEFSVPEDAITPAIERSLLMGRRRPPDITSIWIGNYTGGSWDNAYARFSGGIGVGVKSRGQLSSSGKNVQSQSMIAGKLFLQAVTTTEYTSHFVPRRPIFFLVMSPPDLAPLQRGAHLAATFRALGCAGDSDHRGFG